MVSNFFTDYFTGRPSDDNGSSDGGSTIIASKSNVIESPKQPQINVSTSDLPTPNINIISPTEFISSEINVISPTDSNVSDITTELPTYSPASNSPTSDTPTTSNTPITSTHSPVRTFSSRSFNDWANSQSRVVSNLEIPHLNDPFSDVSPVQPSPIDPVSITLPESPSSNITSPVNPADVNLPDSASSNVTSPVNPAEGDLPDSTTASPSSSKAKVSKLDKYFVRYS